jgi:hypothetical protein
MAGRQVRTTLSGFALWALDRYQKANGKTEGDALAALFQRWLDIEGPEFLQRFGISHEAYGRAQGDNVIGMGRRKRSRGKDED